MPELRRDPITRRWIVMAPTRALRPNENVVEEPTVDAGGFCPFCEGSEETTPNEILAYRSEGSSPNGPGWELRVVPNRYPALHVEGTPDARGEGLYDVMNGIGAHEVIIESPHHETRFEQLPEHMIANVFWAYRDRLLDLRKDTRLKSVQIFKNSGASAGASLTHVHSQLIACPFVPSVLATELESGLAFYRDHERCLFCDLLRQERESGERIVSESERFTVLCPYASRFPFETWILPKRHGSHFERVDRSTIEELGRVVKQTLTKIARAVNGKAYNYVLHTAPLADDDLPHFHWHLEILPRITTKAGFEWGTGSDINIVLPEDAAQFLRNA